MIENALGIAISAHKGQLRKGGNIPYILHVIEAGVIGASLSIKLNQEKEEIIVACILHDIIEDTSITYQDLSAHFNENVLKLVRLQSEDKTKSWQERKEATIALLKSNEDVNFEIVILSDKLSNLRSIHRDYQAIGDQLWERFNVKDKHKHKWYYSAIGNEIKHLRDTTEYKEYIELLKVFK